MMKLVIFAARLLLGLVFLVFGLNHLFLFIKGMPMPTGDALAIMMLMMAHKWFIVYGLVEAVAGLMLLSGRFVPLALTLLGGMGVNILLFVITLTPAMAGLPIFLALLELLLVYGYRASFAGIFASKAQPTLL
jgi:putative oxidoreductase